MTSIYDWSKTADDNGASDAVAPWPEGMARRQVNNSARGMMKRIAEFRDDISATLPSGGTANALTITPNSDFTALANGRILAFRSSMTNTGAATLNVNSLGAKAIRKFTALGQGDVDAGDIRTNGLYVVMYSSTLDGGTGGWFLLNPPSRSLVLETPQVTTSGTTVDFTGIPADTKRITVMFNSLSTNGTGDVTFWMTLGDSGGFEVAGYVNTLALLENGQPTVTSSSTDSIWLAQTSVGQSVHGTAILTRINTAHRWIATVQTSNSTNSTMTLVTSNKALSAELDRLRIGFTGGSAFDAGSVNIMYEI